MLKGTDLIRGIPATIQCECCIATISALLGLSNHIIDQKAIHYFSYGSYFERRASNHFCSEGLSVQRNNHACLEKIARKKEWGDHHGENKT